jgi:pyruvate dehydrogenase E2 component (dihydrolipoamide acetyltransferase)
MPYEITMPQLSDTMTEGVLVKWNKKEGDAIKTGEEVAEVETDKATMPMEAFEGGTLAVQMVKEGGKVPVGALVGVIAKKGEDVAALKAKYASGGASVGAAAPAAQASATATASAGTTATIQASAPVVSVGSFSQPATVAHGNGDDRVKASPLARRIAETEGVDLKALQGSGPSGRIVQKDVLTALELKSTTGAKSASSTSGVATSVATAPATKPTPVLPQRIASGATEAIPLTKMRQTIATRLQQAKQQIPHIYLSIDVEVDALMSLREKLNKSLEAEKIRLSVNDFICKACAVTLKLNPGMNAIFDEKNNQVVRYGDVHLGNAVALPDGLIVAVLRSTDQMGLREIRLKSADLFDRAKQQRLKQDEMMGHTFTISNLGAWGVTDFAAIVNPPAVGILAVAAAEQRAVVRNGQVVARNMMTLTLSADHRAVDGALAAEFLKTLKAMLEEPGMMIV